MQADSGTLSYPTKHTSLTRLLGNLDPALLSFLKRYFPVEVKAKQKENERNAAIDRYGEEFDRCQIM